MFIPIALALLLLSPFVVVAQETLRWEILSAKLPKPLSDHSATLSDLVYIAGGCDNANGNVYSDGTGTFVCNSISSSFFSFDIESQEFETLADLPRSRYRHAAAAVDGKIWIVGGRDLNDTLIAQVDVYDISTGTWSTPGSLPAEYQTSDEAAYAHDEYVYVVGGYNGTYHAHDQMFRIDGSQSTSSLVIDTVSPLNEARGDISGAFDGTYAYVSGGFTDADLFCEPLGTVERYTFATDTWQQFPSLNTARADKALVLLNGRLFAVGGERQIENICQLTEENRPDPGELTIAVDDVEFLEMGAKNWTVLSSLPEHRFRFAAVAKDNVIYTFGGQQAYDSSCKCFRATDSVVVYTDETSTSNAMPAVVMSMLVATAALASSIWVLL